MRTLLLASTAAAAALLLPGCLTCGFEGQDDIVKRRDNGDAMILCANGGYAATLATGDILEGKYGYSETGLVGTIGETGAVRFTLTTDVRDGLGYSDELGDGWATVTLDAYELDKAHIQCTDLETRAWFYAGPSASHGTLAAVDEATMR